MKKRAWSFSVLDMFENCRKKYYHLKVLKDRKEPDNDAQRDGKAIHLALYERVINGKALPVPMRNLEKMANKFALAKGEKYGEMKLCLNEKFEPVDWFAKDAWVRAVLDLLIVQGDTAIVVDYKTGKRKDRFDQLELAAAVLSFYMPEIKNFRLVFVWTRSNEISQTTLAKTEMRKVWLNYLPRTSELDKAWATTDFPANPTPLCGWCPITECPHWIDRD